MKRMIVLMMGAATFCQAMDIVLCLDEIAMKKKSERCGYKTYLDDSDPTLRMEKIWHHETVKLFDRWSFDDCTPRDEKPVGIVIKKVETKKTIEEEEKRVAILKELQDRRERVVKIFGNIFENQKATTALVVFQLVAAPLLSPIIEPSYFVPAPQESFNVEKIDVQKIAALSIKKAPVFQHNKFLSKNEKRSSRKKSYRIQQPQRRR